MHYTSHRFVFFTSELTDVIYLQILPELSKKRLPPLLKLVFAILLPQSSA